MEIETSVGVFDPMDFATGFRFPVASGNGIVRVSPMKSGKWYITHDGNGTVLFLATDGTWRNGQFLSPDALADVSLLGHELTQALALAYEHAQTAKP